MEYKSENLEEQQQHPYGYIQNGKVFRKGFLDFPDREIGEVKDTEASAIAYFENRFSLISNKVAKLEQNIDESQNKGSYLMKLKHLKEQLPKFDALGDYTTLYQKLEKREQELNHYINNNRAKNLEIKRALIAEAEHYENSVDWKDATEKFKELKQKWVKTGKVTEEFNEEIESRFQEILDNFFKRKKEFFEEKQKLIDDRVKAYEKIIEDIKSWASHEEDPEKAAKEIKTLQKKWNEVGSIPAPKKKPLQDKFKKVTNDFFQVLKQKRKQNKHSDAKEKDQKIAQKEEILKKAKKYTDAANKQAVEDIKKLRKEWKEIGNIPGPRAKKIADEFNETCDLIFEKHFLNNLVRSKHKDFNDKNEKDQVKVKMQLLRELINRDLKALEQYKENIEHFNADEASMNKLVNGKLRMQERKVHVKQQLMEELQKKINSIA